MRFSPHEKNVVLLIEQEVKEERDNIMVKMREFSGEKNFFGVSEKFGIVD